MGAAPDIADDTGALLYDLPGKGSSWACRGSALG